MNVTLNSKTAVADLNNQASQAPKKVAKQVEPAPVVQEATPEPTPEPVAQPQPTPVVTEYHSDDYYMEQIFAHESSNNPYARNSIGCLGLGQACPGEKLLSVCPDLGDVTCQYQFFYNYAVSRYGSPANAWAVWQQQHWW